MQSGDDLKSLGIIGNKATITRGQELQLFRVSKGMFDNDSATRELLGFRRLDVVQGIISRLFLWDKNAGEMNIFET